MRRLRFFSPLRWRRRARSALVNVTLPSGASAAVSYRVAPPELRPSFSSKLTHGLLSNLYLKAADSGLIEPPTPPRRAPPPPPTTSVPVPASASNRSRASSLLSGLAAPSIGGSGGGGGGDDDTKRSRSLCRALNLAGFSGGALAAGVLLRGALAAGEPVAIRPVEEHAEGPAAAEVDDRARGGAARRAPDDGALRRQQLELLQRRHLPLSPPLPPRPRSGKPRKIRTRPESTLRRGDGRDPGIAREREPCRSDGHFGDAPPPSQYRS
ncbi:hypothetical protein NL676_005432 [Syzygium grande]|nr:hypothetical protein NL676_005432 [Syzygium grande]